VRAINDLSQLNPAIPGFSDLIDGANDDFFDLSWSIVDERSWLFHVMIDRAFLQWNNDLWEIKAGRQRINWGVNLVWNPNDLFNAFSFFDFDYEERPGADAIRITRYTGFASSMEIGVNIADDLEDFVAGGLWKINKGTYDIQFLGSYARQDVALGAGWAGNIKNSGFKGEMTYFIPTVSSLDDAFALSLTFDHSFKSSLYLHGSFLFNSNGTKDPLDAGFIISQLRITARDLSPYKYNLFLQSSYQFHSLITGGIATIYYPSDQALFINPTATVSVLQSLDLDIIAQLFFDDPAGENFRVVSKLFFARLKWSF